VALASTTGKRVLSREAARDNEPDRDLKREDCLVRLEARVREPARFMARPLV